LGPEKAEETDFTNEETEKTKANEEVGSQPSMGSQPRFARCGDQLIVVTSSDCRQPLFVTTLN
jgi:hypothetical protein